MSKHESGNSLDGNLPVGYDEDIEIGNYYRKEGVDVFSLQDLRDEREDTDYTFDPSDYPESAGFPSGSVAGAVFGSGHKDIGPVPLSPILVTQMHTGIADPQFTDYFPDF